MSKGYSGHCNAHFGHTLYDTATVSLQGGTVYFKYTVQMWQCALDFMIY